MMTEDQRKGEHGGPAEIGERTHAMVESPPGFETAPFGRPDRSGRKGFWTITVDAKEDLSPGELRPPENGDALARVEYEEKEDGRLLRLYVPGEAKGDLAETFADREEEAAFWREIDRTMQRYERRHRMTFPSGGTLDLSGRPALMGVLNVTPDSFSDGGKYTAKKNAVQRGLELEEQGASVVDVGGESTRPGADPVTVEEEKERTIPVVETLSDGLSVPVSIDTRKPSVARAAIEAGSEMINDVGGLQREPELLELADERDVPVVAMHMQGTPRTMQDDPGYRNVIRDVGAFLRRSKRGAVKAGLEPSRIVLDPGIGFGKTLEHNLELVRHVHQFRSFGCPVLLGTSRKSFIGDILGVSVDQRLEGTAASLAGPALTGVEMFRVHDVREMYRFLNVLCRIHADADWKENLFEPGGS